MSTELPDWIAVGAKVAEYTHGASKSVRLDTIKRLTATHIVLASGRRYRRDSLRPVGDSKRSTWSAIVQLRPADDPQVLDVRARQRLAAVHSGIGRVVRDVGATREDVLAALDDIEQIVKAARVAILNPEV